MHNAGTVWVHHQCGLWSSEVFIDETNSQLVNLAQAVHRGRRTDCTHCCQQGATLKCFHRECCMEFHLSCARCPGCILLSEAYTILLPRSCSVSCDTLRAVPPASTLSKTNSSRPTWLEG
eukprot:jgi/Chrzof1/13130/Cz07g21020.t1